MNEQVDALSQYRSVGPADASTITSQLDPEQRTSVSPLGPTCPLHTAPLSQASVANTVPVSATRHVEAEQLM